MVNLNFENLGNIKKGTINLKPFTIFCGDNNTGKTYIAYSIYALLDKEFNFDFKESRDIVKKLYQDGLYELNILEFTEKNLSKLKREIEKGFKDNLHFVFNAEEEDFKKSSFTFDIDKKSIIDNIKNSELNLFSSIGKKDNIVFEATKDRNSNIIKFVLHDNKMSGNFLSDTIKNIISKVIFRELFSNSFLLPAERTGLNLFYKELAKKRTALLHHLQKKDINTMELIKDLLVSRYPQPIGDYIDFLNDIHNLKKMKSEYKNFAYLIQKDIIHGKYRVEKDGSIYFIPYKNSSNRETFNEKISLHMTSSTVKTFFSLVFYLEHLAKKGDTLIIDEPELNLHPDNQRKIARILSIITNKGINVIVSTHSDYFVKELNNLIMLNNIKNRENLLKKYGYKEDMIIKLENIEAYLFDKNEIKKLNKTEEEGIEFTTFDEVINRLNKSSDDIYFSALD